MSRHLGSINIAGTVISVSFGGITQTSQSSLQIMDSVALLLTAVILVSTVVVLIVYHRRIRDAGEKYEEAKSVVGDVVVSYNSQLRMQEEALEKLSYKVEGIDGRNEAMMHRVSDLENHKTVLPEKMTELAGKQDSLFKEIAAVKSDLEKLRSLQEGFEKQMISASEAGIETAIPIRRERALEPLTPTELHVLEFIATEGEKTAPEIRDIIKLTREHSARLVKKLYEEGYLERDITKTPYKYRVKDEMLKILKKPEANPQT